MEAIYDKKYDGPTTKDLIEKAKRETPEGSVLTSVVLNQEEWKHMLREYEWRESSTAVELMLHNVLVVKGVR